MGETNKFRYSELRFSHDQAYKEQARVNESTHR